MNYDHKKIEDKWQKFWKDNQTYKAENNSDKPKYYVLDMFPYPSGAGLHVGHPLGYIASDIFARYKRHKGYNVLHPMGYDSFGLPAEQYAIQTGQHPAKTTETNIKRYREQLDQLGFSFDWDREVRTSNPDYYRWTQWIFIQLFHSWYNKVTDRAEDIATLVKKFEASGTQGVNAVCDDGVEAFSKDEWVNFSEQKKQELLLSYRLTYLAETEVNWCPALSTVLANDEVVNGVSERGGHPVVRKKMKQWSMRITAYAERLLQGLEAIDWSESLKETQRNWIGKSEGALIKFQAPSPKPKAQSGGASQMIEVFTTRPDTIFGVSFMVLAPEHELVPQLATPEQKAEVEAYVETTARRSERERMADTKTFTGVFTGAYAEHPFTGKPIPIWIADYVLASYGTGAIMAVPAGDQRDHDFAGKFNLPIPNIFREVDVSKEAFAEKEGALLTNSGFLDGLDATEAIEKTITELEKAGIGHGKTQYRLRDAVFSRQRYWGEPFPVYYKGGLPYTLPEKDLPLELPEVEKYLPTEDGRPPLGNAKKWDYSGHPLELNTMPGWAGSSWYWLRYMDPDNEKEFAGREALNYWKNVDLYIGGSEHAAGHLLYARFWTKFLKDRSFIQVDEPFKKLINQGMVLGTSAIVYRVSGQSKYISKGLKKDYDVEKIRVDVNLVNASDELDIDGLKKWQPQYKDAEFVLEGGKYIVGREVEKMSKRWHNVINPDDICDQYGADTLRMYEMFLGPIEQAKPWNTAGISGVHGFLKKLWKLYQKAEGRSWKSEVTPTRENLKTLHKTIKKVTEDIEGFSFNTAVSAFMIAVNELTAQKCNSPEVLEPLLVLLSPFAPHMAEELWHRMGHNGSITAEPFPGYDEKYLAENTKAYPVSFNGKVRFTLELPLDIPRDEVEKTVLAHDKTRHYLNGSEPKKVIVVPGKIVNIVF